MKSPITKIIQKIPPRMLGDLIIMGSGVVLALLIRYSLRGFESGDYIYSTQSWYATIKDQGFRAFSSNFSNYTPLYLYCLYVVSVVLPPIHSVFAIKLPSILADVICAWYVYRIVRLKYQGDSPLPFFSFMTVLFAPTVVLNSAFWGQADSLYTAALMACLYYLLIKRETYSMLAFGIAFALKLQAIFLIPLLAGLILKRVLSWKQTGFIPMVYIITIIPAWLAGRSLYKLITIYVAQVNTFDALTLNAPNLYTWIPPNMYKFFYPAGLIGAIGICFLFVVGVYKSRTKLTSSIITQLALASVMIMPYFLPKMHERYFYIGDVLSIVYGFYYPKYFFVPILIGLASFFAYQPFLFGREIIPLSFLALVLLSVIVMIVRHTIMILYSEGE